MYDGKVTESQVSLVTASTSVELVSHKRAHLVQPDHLVELAREVSLANDTIKAVACGKLEIIAQQIRLLQEQARQVLVDAVEDELINSAECNFVKKAGNIYHCYNKNGKSYLSMLSPEDWGGTPPHEFIGSYKLESDLTFTPSNKVKRRGEERNNVEELFAQRNNISTSPLSNSIYSIDWTNRPHI